MTGELGEEGRDDTRTNRGEAGVFGKLEKWEAGEAPGFPPSLLSCIALTRRASPRAAGGDIGQEGEASREQ